MARTVAIGKQDFSSLIENDYFYVDKTGFIKKWWENGDDVTLITRPRRFGKTLTMSMVDQFFSIEHADKKGLFEGLAIWKEEKYKKLQGTYPVIFFSFANVKEDNFADCYTRIVQELSSIYNQHVSLLDSDALTDMDREFFREVKEDMRAVTAKIALNRLSEFLYKYYGKKVIILLDEYDTPMQEAYVNGYWKELSGFIRGLFNSTFKTNPYLERAILTGITRVSKESIFSDLNNLEVVTTLSKKYETVFGFTEDEVFQALEEYGLKDHGAGVRHWYDGFRFGESESIYNPWSMINFLEKGEFEAYWTNTSSNSMVDALIKNGSRTVKEAMEKLLQGESVKASFQPEVVFDQLDHKNSAIWSFLVAGGYLKTAKKEVNEKGNVEYWLSITNFEVQQMFQEMILDWFYPNTDEFNAFCDALVAGDVPGMQRCLQEDALVLLSSYDTQSENSYHMFVLGLVASLQFRYRIRSNREAGFGRYDTLLYPKDGQSDGIVLEYKRAKNGDRSTLQATVDEALDQIIRNRYFADMEADGLGKEQIRIYGFAFVGKNVLINGGYLSDYDNNEN